MTLVAHNSSRIDQHVSAAGQVSNQLSTIAGSPWQPNGDMKNETIPRWQDQFTHTRDLGIQVTLSIALGLGAFIAFCILRPKWTKLYHARKKQSGAASQLPDLPKTMFGWIPVLYRISETEVLDSAGLDAYVVSHSRRRRQRASAGAQDKHAPLVESVRIPHC